MPLAIDRHPLAKLGVDAGAVQAFRVILPEALPVAGNLGLPSVPGDKPVHRPVIQRFQRHIRPDRPRLTAKVQEQKPVPHPRRHKHQPMRGAVEIIGRHGMAGCHQPPVVRRKGKGVIGTADQLAQRLHGLPAQLRPPVRAHVVPGCHGPIRRPRDNHRRSPHRHPCSSCQRQNWTVAPPSPTGGQRPSPSRGRTSPATDRPRAAAPPGNGPGAVKADGAARRSPCRLRCFRGPPDRAQSAYQRQAPRAGAVRVDDLRQPWAGDDMQNRVVITADFRVASH
jgi:hypothetical protein